MNNEIRELEERKRLVETLIATARRKSSGLRSKSDMVKFFDDERNKDVLDTIFSVEIEETAMLTNILRECGCDHNGQWDRYVGPEAYDKVVEELKDIEYKLEDYLRKLENEIKEEKQREEEREA